MKGWYNNNCDVNDLIINRNTESQFIEKYLLKYVPNDLKVKINYQARQKENENNSCVFKMKYPEGGEDVEWP